MPAPNVLNNNINSNNIPVIGTNASNTNPTQREQELLIHIQELQRQLSIIQIEKNSNPSTNTPKDALIDDNPSSHSVTTQLQPNKQVTDDNDLNKTQQRLIMVSNRLPISVSRDKETDEFVFSMSSGGLVTALNGLRDSFPFIWIGWFGQEVEDSATREKIREQLFKQFRCVPVFLNKEIADKYYNDFSNGVLWPIFHYVPLPMLRAGAEKKFDFQLWDAYNFANQEFAHVINDLYKEGDIVWVHDYHLMVLPTLLRKRHPSCTIGWFLHTPFPTSEIYRILPVRKEILEGLLGVDLLGFHTYDYARHFLSACSKILGVNSSPKGVEYNGHFTSIGVFPIGIDPENFLNKMKTEESERRIVELCEKFEGKKVIVGVDRLDYIKGMPHRLLAIERLLIRYPEWREKVILVQIAVPSRTDVEEYKQLASRINKLVGRINGNFGTLTYSPIHYINRGVTPAELVALYNIADVCLVTSVRDGMNLVSYEYVVCQNKPCKRRDGPGVLVLSEFAGSAQSLSGAIRINPWNNDQMANALHQSLTLPLAEREYRQVKLFRYVTTHSAAFWAKSYLTDLQEAYNRGLTSQKLLKLPISDVLNDYRNSKNRLFIFDYDGALSETQSLSRLTQPKPLVRKILEKLTLDEKNTVFIVSEREREFLQNYFNGMKIGIVAENGFYVKSPISKEWNIMGQGFETVWRKVVQPIMQYFTERTPGSYIESKESSLSWYYQEADTEFGTMQARDMQLHLEDVLCNLPLDVLQGSQVMEVRPQGTSKSDVVREALNYLTNPDIVEQNGKIDFVFCVGDNHADDNMFLHVKNDFQSTKEIEDAELSTFMSDSIKNYTCLIGTDNKSQATYNLEMHSDLRRLLKSFVAPKIDVN